MKFLIRLYFICTLIFLTTVTAQAQWQLNTNAPITNSKEYDVIMHQSVESRTEYQVCLDITIETSKPVYSIVIESTNTGTCNDIDYCRGIACYDVVPELDSVEIVCHTQRGSGTGQRSEGCIITINPY